MLTDRNLVKLLHSIMALCGMYAEKTSSIISSLELDVEETISEKLAQEVKEDKKKAELLRKTKIKVGVFCRHFFQGVKIGVVFVRSVIRNIFYPQKINFVGVEKKIILNLSQFFYPPRKIIFI